MGGGGGGKGSSSSGTPGFIKKISKEQWAIAKPVMMEWGRQLLEALTTGGVSAQIPIIQRAVEAARMGNARALQGTKESLARSGIGGTFARGIEATQRQAGEFDTSQVMQRIIMNMIGGGSAQGFGMLSGSPVFGAISPTSQSTGGAGGLLSGFGNLMAGGAALGGLFCWLALELYGPTPAFFFARYWLGIGWKGRTARVVRALYRRQGPNLACLAHRFSAVRTISLWVMGKAAQRGERTLQRQLCPSL